MSAFSNSQTNSKIPTFEARHPGIDPLLRMIIPVRLAGDGLDGDWALMELQGLLERGEEDSFRNMNIGDLTFEGVRGRA